MGTKIAHADKLFSILVRLKAMDSNGYVQCFTCEQFRPFKELQCGHYIKRGHYATRWLEENAKPQCHECNVIKSGNYEVYTEMLNYDHEGLPERLKDLERNAKFKLSSSDLDQIIDMLNKRIKECGGMKSVP